MDISELKIGFVEVWFHLVPELSRGALGGNATRRVRGGQHSSAETQAVQMRETTQRETVSEERKNRSNRSTEHCRRERQDRGWSWAL